MTPQALQVLFVAGMIPPVLAAWFLFAAFEKGAKASVAIPLTALYPLVTIGLAFVFLSERLTSLEWVGVLLALGGAAMLSYEKQA
jgi:drug/metabolite transporter (DMT)-like permease